MKPYEFTDIDRVKDDKYIVFKRDEYARWFHVVQKAAANYDVDLPRYLPDAVVIRTQDVFAGPALHGYAAALSIAIHVLKNIPVHDPDQVQDLQDIADYFHLRAVEADDGPRKLPD